MGQLSKWDELLSSPKSESWTQQLLVFDAFFTSIISIIIYCFYYGIVHKARD